MAKASGMAKKAGGSTTAGADRACSNGESGENECSNGVPHSEGRVGTVQPICHGCGQGKKLL